jgi:sugar/nucleoside kinase (ribokinase family)
MTHLPAFPTNVVSTAGAGDAHIAGIICGLAAGLHLQQAQELGGLVAALAISSPHTIAPDVNRASLRDYVLRETIQVCIAVRNLLV